MSPVNPICAACGLCCNGVLFGNVELQESDNSKRLALLGLNLERKGKVIRFSQPCSCFDGTLCRIYEDRPSRCRSFDCRLLQRVQAGKRTVEQALKSVGDARRHVGIVRQLLEKLGQTEDRLPLSRRCAQAIGEPIDLAASEEQIEFRAELMLAIHKLTRILERDFLT